MKSSLFVKQALGTLLFFSVIFLCAGRLDYWQGLLYVATGLIMLALNYTALRPDDELLKERTKPGEGAKKWDKIILGLSFLATIGMYCTAGFDSGRYLWSPQFHWSLYLSGILLTVAGQLLFLIAQKQNRFFPARLGFRRKEVIPFVIPGFTVSSGIRRIWVRLSRLLDFLCFLVLYGV